MHNLLLILFMDLMVCLLLGTALAPVLSSVGTWANNGDGVQGEGGNATGSAELAGSGSGSVRVLPMRNIIAAAVPSRPVGAAISTAAQPGSGLSVPQLSANPGLLPSAADQMNSQIRNFVGNMIGENQVPSGRYP